MVAKRVNEKPRKNFTGALNKKLPPKRNNNSVDIAKTEKAFQDINKNNDDFAKRAKKNPILYFYSAYGAIDSLNTNIKNLKALEEAGVIKLPNIGIHYDNIRNTVIRETTKAGNSVYAAKIPIISNGLGRFLGATNMPKNAGLMSTIGAYYRGVYIKGLFGTADGIYSTVAHPIKTVEGLTDILVNPGMLVKAVKNYTNEKIIHGSSEDRAELLGHAAFEIGLAVVTNGSAKSGKGAKKAIGSSKAADIADDVGDISKGSKAPSKISGIGDEIAGGSNIKQPSKIVYSSKATEIGEQAGDMAGIDKKISPVKPPSKITEPNNPAIELPKTEKSPIEIPESKNPTKLPELEKSMDKVDDIAKEKPLYKEYIKPEDKKIVPEMGWDMPDGGAIINGREYTKHALERMAPDTPSVRAELIRRGAERAKSKGYVVGSDEYIDDIIDYVQPRDIPPSVVENAISSTKPFIGNKPGTLTYITDDVKVVTDFSGKVITVMKQ